MATVRPQARNSIIYSQARGVRPATTTRETTPGAVRPAAPLFEVTVAALLVELELVVDPLVVIAVAAVTAESVVLVAEALRVVAAAAL